MPSSSASKASVSAGFGSVASSDTEDNWDADFGDIPVVPLSVPLPKQQGVSHAKSDLAQDRTSSLSSSGNDAMHSSARGYAGHRKGIISASQAAEELNDEDVNDDHLDSSAEKRPGGALQRKDNMRISAQPKKADSKNDDDQASLPTITGIKANPVNVECGWEDDFDFGDDAINDLQAKLNASSTILFRSSSKESVLSDEMPRLPLFSSSINGESRDISEARFLLQSIPNDIVVSKGSSSESMWFHCDKTHIFPPWFKPDESQTQMRKACDLWKQGLTLLSQAQINPASLSILSQIFSLFDDYNSLSPMNVSFICLVALHIASLAKQMGDPFASREKLQRGIEIAASEYMLNNEPFCSDALLASLRAALYFEYAQVLLTTNTEQALPYALKVLRTVIMEPGKNVPSKSPNW